MLITNVIKKIDLFGAEFNFTIFGEKSYRTFFGGMLSLLVILTTITISIMFGLDLLLRKNPIVLKETVVPEYYEYINVTLQNFPIFWRIEDDNNAVVNFTNILYPQLNFYVYKFNNSSGQWDYLDKKTMSTKHCNRSIVNNDYIFDKFGLNNFYCFDWAETGYPIGGSWDSGDMVYYFEQVIFTCPNDNTTSPNCTNTTFLKNWLGTSNKIYYSIIYPLAYFSPGNFTNPLQASYVNYFQLLSANLYKKNRYFFTKTELERDTGWIFTDTNNYSIITYDRNNFDIDNRPDTDINNPSISSNIYATTIYFVKNHDKYTMSYIKMQDLAAQTGGFMKIVMVFFFVFNYHLNEFNRDVDVMNEIYEFDKETKDKVSLLTDNNFRRMKGKKLTEILNRKTCK